MGINLNVGNSIKTVSEIKMNINGTLRNVTEVWKNVNGTLRRVWPDQAYDGSIFGPPLSDGFISGVPFFNGVDYPQMLYYDYPGDKTLNKRLTSGAMPIKCVKTDSYWQVGWRSYNKIDVSKYNTLKVKISGTTGDGKPVNNFYFYFSTEANLSTSDGKGTQLRATSVSGAAFGEYSIAFNNALNSLKSQPLYFGVIIRTTNEGSASKDNSVNATVNYIKFE